MIHGDRHTMVNFQNVHYTPNLSANLLSVSQLDDVGVNLSFAGGGVVWEREGVSFANGTHVGKLYKMNFKSKPAGKLPIYAHQGQGVIVL